MVPKFIVLIYCFAAPTLLAADDQAKLPRIIVSDDGRHFVQEGTGRPFRPMGFNYDHDAGGRLIEDYWHTEWDRVENDFRDMQTLNANTVRIHLQFGRFMKSPTEPDVSELSQLAKLLKLAEECNLYIDLTGLGCYHKKDVPAWYDQLSEADRWAAQAEFWKAIATECRESNAVFCYDLMNEPVIGGEQPAADWLGPAFAGKHFVQFVARQTSGRERHVAAKQWVDAMTSAVRSVDDRHLITVGLVDWSLNRPGLTSGFDPTKVAESLDFLAVHLYPKADKVDDALITLKGFQIGKPVIIEETFPLSCSMDDMADFMSKAGDDSCGWISFFWGKLPDEYDPKASIGDAVTSDWLRKFSATFADAIPTAMVADDGPSDGEAIVAQFAERAEKNPDGKAPFSVDRSAWNEPTNNLPIGVFDSGIGGLTVLEAILKLDEHDNVRLTPGADGRPDFQDERFIYFGDQANMPYGNYSAVNKQLFLKELILKDTAFLLGRRYWPVPTAKEPAFDKPPVKAIVIACNTATAWGLDEIRQLADRWKLPVFVVGVVEAGARGVSERIGSSGDRHTVAVLATVGTCSSNAYPKAIQKSVGIAGRKQPAVIQQGSVGMAAAIESDPAFVISTKSNSGDSPPYQGPAFEHPTAKLRAEHLITYRFDAAGLLGDPEDPKSLRLNSTENYIRYDVATLVEAYRESGGTKPIDTIVLGCTHFPLVEKEILAAFEALRTLESDGLRPFSHLIADKIAVVDPARLTARELFYELSQRRLRATHAETTNEKHPKARDLFFISVANNHCSTAKLDPNGALNRDYKYSRSPGQLHIEDTICVPMTLELLPVTSVNLIRTKLPNVWARLSAPATAASPGQR